jgi:hypothetical protein
MLGEFFNSRLNLLSNFSNQTWGHIFPPPITDANALEIIHLDVHLFI